MKRVTKSLILFFVLIFSQMLTADEWYSAPSLLVPRGGAAAVTYGNYIYVFGGKSIENKVLNSVERYDILAAVWDTTVVPDFNYPRYNATAVIFNEMIYLMGGQDGEKPG